MGTLSTLLLRENEELGRGLWWLGLAWFCSQLYLQDTVPVAARLRVAWWSASAVLYATAPDDVVAVLRRAALVQNRLAGGLYFGIGCCCRALALSGMAATHKVEVLWAAAASLSALTAERGAVCSLIAAACSTRLGAVCVGLVTSRVGSPLFSHRMQGTAVEPPLSDALSAFIIAAVLMVAARSSGAADHADAARGAPRAAACRPEAHPLSPSGILQPPGSLSGTWVGSQSMPASMSLSGGKTQPTSAGDHSGEGTPIEPGLQPRPEDRRNSDPLRRSPQQGPDSPAWTITVPSRRNSGRSRLGPSDLVPLPPSAALVELHDTAK
eukprot:TRINITY_DN10033_c3_g1_i1.p1 TRINITY_DN10033_c3_g1~~TRINITY_DN10033_c3_g1_i1.p1  ORF type:complete len:353 (+),score=130.36 TRINITY_DN10033_c3_g1_i1:85-1059(+)